MEKILKPGNLEWVPVGGERAYGERSGCSAGMLETVNGPGRCTKVCFLATAQPVASSNRRRSRDCGISLARKPVVWAASAIAPLRVLGPCRRHNRPQNQRTHLPWISLQSYCRRAGLAISRLCDDSEVFVKVGASDGPDALSCGVILYYRAPPGCRKTARASPIAASRWTNSCSPTCAV